MTATDEAPIKSHEAARGARLARLTAIDLDYAKFCADAEAESVADWAAAIAASCARVDAAMAGLIVDTSGVLIGNPLRVLLASRRIVAELDEMTAEWYGNQFRLHLALDALEAWRLAERYPFDFLMTPPPPDAEAIVADLAATEPEGATA